MLQHMCVWCNFLETEDRLVEVRVKVKGFWVRARLKSSGVKSLKVSYIGSRGTGELYIFGFWCFSK